MLASLVGSVACVAISAASSGALHPNNPFKLFVLSCGQKGSFNVVALIDQRDPFGNGWQRVQVIRDRHGVIAKSVLSPFSEQGTKSLDDGKRWRTILPDEEVVLDQKSPIEAPNSLQRRCLLAKRNYSFSLAGKSSVADHACYVVNIQPHCTELPSWNLFLDSTHSYPLRIDTGQPQQMKVKFISRSVEFPKSIDPALVAVDSPPTFRVVTFNHPEDMSDWKTARRELGFEPIVPNHWPLGFQMEDVQVNRDNLQNTFILRLSDGMARASVYEYVLGKELKGMKPFENSSRISNGDVELMIVSDIPEGCRQKLLTVFAVSSSSESARNTWRTLRKSLAKSGTKPGY